MIDGSSSSPRARAPLLFMLLVGLGLGLAGWRANLGRLGPLALGAGLVTAVAVTAILINRAWRRRQGPRD